jgi:uncharacterized protein (TIGR03435 family)
MLKALLSERFRLKTHVEPREMALYDLVLARNDGRLGPQLKPSKPDCSSADEIDPKRAEALATGDLAAVMPKPGEFLSCTIAPNLADQANPSLHGDGQELKALVNLLSQFTGRHVRDKTGLTGRYDFDLKIDLQALLGVIQKLGVSVPTDTNSPQAVGSSVLTALNEQLGLTLESSRGPVDVLVSVQAATPN